MRIMVLNLHDQLEELPRLAWDCLSKGERKWVATLPDGVRRNEWILGRYVLKKHFNHLLAPTMVEFLPDRDGRPQLMLLHADASFNADDIVVSLSHKPPYFLTASSCKKTEGWIGADIEKIRTWSKEFWGRCLTDSEIHLMNAAPTDQQDEVGFRLWTLKEAILKAIGKGFSIDLRTVDCTSLYHQAEGNILGFPVFRQWGTVDSFVYCVVLVQCARLNHGVYAA
jgi:phosphopantetheinyl transferase